MIKTKDGKTIPIPDEGSLGLLAAGYKGIQLWRRHQLRSEENRWFGPVINGEELQVLQYHHEEE